jgi:hypothetical protein
MAVDLMSTLMGAALKGGRGGRLGRSPLSAEALRLEPPTAAPSTPAAPATPATPAAAPKPIYRSPTTVLFR